MKYLGVPFLGDRLKNMSTYIYEPNYLLSSEEYDLQEAESLGNDTSATFIGTNTFDQAKKWPHMKKYTLILT